jgi:hypothetical protein
MKNLLKLQDFVSDKFSRVKHNSWDDEPINDVSMRFCQMLDYEITDDIEQIIIETQEKGGSYDEIARSLEKDLEYIEFRLKIKILSKLYYLGATV